jgi:hypothetical protein
MHEHPSLEQLEPKRRPLDLPQGEQPRHGPLKPLSPTATYEVSVRT